MDEIQIASGEIQPKLLAGKVHGGGAAQWSIVHTGRNIVELQFVIGQPKIASYEWDRCPVNRGVADFNPAFAVALSSGAESVECKIGDSSQRPAGSGQACDFCHIGIANIETQRNGRAGLGYTRNHGRTGVEARRSVAMDQGAIAGHETLARILHGSSKRIPLNRLRGTVTTCRERSLEVIHFEISTHLHEGQPASNETIEVR